MQDKTDAAGDAATEDGRDYNGKFLVVIDETPECDRAVSFAAYRVRRTGGGIVLMAVVEPDQFQHWLGVEKIMRAEAFENAEALLNERIERIRAIGKIKVETVVREGRAPDEIEKLIDEDKSISILVLAASISAEGPGPLVSAFASRGANALPVPVTIVPGSLSDEQIASMY